MKFKSQPKILIDEIMQIFRNLLYPLLPVYAAIIKLRNLLFDKSVFKSEKVNAKVISVGNLNVGGSGKTPMVIYITKLLKKNGFSAGVLSRGYGRKSKGYRLVSDGNKILTSVAECGDEIFQTSTECKVPAAVSENRVIGAKKLIKSTGVNTIVLDDAFQHRWIYRDADLVIIDQSFINSTETSVKTLLPVGELRESFDSLKRADALIVNRKFFEKQKFNSEFLNYFEQNRIFTCYYKAVSFIDVMRKTEYSLDEFKGQDSLVVSGLANPDSFFIALDAIDVNTKNKMFFRDHKHYTHSDIQTIRKEFYTTNSHSVVTTEKDAVKISKFSRELDDIDIFYLKIELCMDDEESFKQFLFNKLNHSLAN